MRWRLAFVLIALAGAAAGGWSHGPRRSDAAPDVPASLAAKCELRAVQLGERLGGECHITTSGPFVVASDLPDQQADVLLRETLEPARVAMQSVYGLPSPSDPVTLVLLQRDASYRHVATLLHGQPPATRFGYFRPGRRTIVANLTHGASPVLHELTHALFSSSSCTAPGWLEEGLASLHEACVIRRSARGWRIAVQDNWRLPALGDSLEAGRLAPLRRLIEDGDDYRDEDEALFYAHARYFCFFLHERSALAGCVQEALAGAQDLESCDEVAGLARLDGRDELEAAFAAWAKARWAHKKLPE
jgi:hypothetical protein